MAQYCSCSTHGFSHYNGILSGYQLYSQHNQLMAFTISRIKRFGMLKFRLYNSSQNTYLMGLEMSRSCSNGINKESNNWFDCMGKNGVIADFSTSCISGTHTGMSYYTDQSISPYSVCCAETQNNSATDVDLKVGSFFVLKQTTSTIKLVGRCKWVGSVNNIDCIAGDLKRNSMKKLPLDFESLGLFPVNDRTILARQEDVTVVKPKENTLLNANGLIRHHQGLIGNCSANVTLGIGLRVKVWYNLLNMDAATQLLFGTLRWAGSIDGHDAVGIELDQTVADGFDKFGIGKDGFSCRSGCGVLAMRADVEVDTDAYLPAFTTGNIDINTMANYEFTENWNIQHVTDKQLHKNMKVFVTIQRDSRYVEFSGILRSVGQMNATTVGIVEMTAYPELNTTLDYLIRPSCETLSEWNKVQPRNQWWQLNHETNIGICSRRGDMLLLVSVDYINKYQQLSEDPKVSGSIPAEAETTCGSLVKQILKSKEMVPAMLDVILGVALQQDDIDTIRIIVRESPLPINIGKYPTVLTKLVNMKWFEEVQSLVSNCLVENNIDSHLIYAAAECLLHGHEALCHSLLGKCKNKDTLMENGESFLTHAIKNDSSDECLLKVMRTEKFDASVCNKGGETPTALACKDALSTFLQHVLSKSQCQPQVSMICPVCDAKSIDTVLNCGHVLCLDCAQEKTNCYSCNAFIRKRRPLHFPQ